MIECTAFPTIQEHKLAVKFQSLPVIIILFNISQYSNVAFAGIKPFKVDEEKLYRSLRWPLALDFISHFTHMAYTQISHKIIILNVNKGGTSHHIM